MIRFIAAIDSRRGLADNKGIPWDLPTDRQYYRNKVAGHPYLIGYGTYQKYAKPLNDTPTFVATHLAEPLRPGFTKVTDARQFLHAFKSGRSAHVDAGQGAGEKRTEAYMQYGEGVSEPATQPSATSNGGVTGSVGKQAVAVRTPDVWVGGGAKLFESAIDLADELYLTHVDGDFHCTKFFPLYEDKFELVQKSPPQTENGINFYFATYRRK